jgi:hypothetical protein
VLLKEGGRGILIFQQLALWQRAVLRLDVLGLKRRHRFACADEAWLCIIQVSAEESARRTHLN